MALLPATQQREVFHEWMEEIAALSLIWGAVVKSDLLGAVVAIDQWCEDNQIAFNQAIPQPARSQLTPKQKAILLALVALKRHRVL